MKISQLFCVVGVASLALLPLSANAKTAGEMPSDVAGEMPSDVKDTEEIRTCKLGPEYLGVPKGSFMTCMKRCGLFKESDVGETGRYDSIEEAEEDLRKRYGVHSKKYNKDRKSNIRFRVVMNKFTEEQRRGGRVYKRTHICPVTAGDKSRPFDKEIYGTVKVKVKGKEKEIGKYLYAVTQCSCSANY